MEVLGENEDPQEDQETKSEQDQHRGYAYPRRNRVVRAQGPRLANLACPDRIGACSLEWQRAKDSDETEPTDQTLSGSVYR
jgi:hypothetical protein